MIITADTNVLVRAVVADDPGQAAAAIEALRQAEAIAVPLPVLCELVWVLRRAYGFHVAEMVEPRNHPVPVWGMLRTPR